MMSPVLKAQEAVEIGIVTKVVPDAEVAAAAHEVAMSLRGPSVTLGYIKRNKTMPRPCRWRVLRRRGDPSLAVGATADHKEAAKAFRREAQRLHSRPLTMALYQAESDLPGGAASGARDLGHCAIMGLKLLPDGNVQSAWKTH